MTEPDLSPRTAADAPSPDEPDPPTAAQREYDGDPALRELLTRATASPTIRRARRRADGRATE